MTLKTPFFCKTTKTSHLRTRARKPDPRDPRVDRAPAPQPGALRARRHQAAQGRPPLRAPGHGKDAPRARDRRKHGRQLPEGRRVGDRRQVHRRVGEADPGDVWVRAGPPAVHHLHGRGKRRFFFPYVFFRGKRRRRRKKNPKNSRHPPPPKKKTIRSTPLAAAASPRAPPPTARSSARSWSSCPSSTASTPWAR